MKKLSHMLPTKSFPEATPQGFACLTMTQEGFSKFAAHSMAASVSAILL